MEFKLNEGVAFRVQLRFSRNSLRLVRCAGVRMQLDPIDLGGSVHPRAWKVLGLGLHPETDWVVLPLPLCLSSLSLSLSLSRSLHSRTYSLTALCLSLSHSLSLPPSLHTLTPRAAYRNPVENLYIQGKDLCRQLLNTLNPNDSLIWVRV